MSSIIYMRFNDKQGAMVGDESTWHLGTVYGYRRTNYGDPITELLSAENYRRTGVVAAYAGTGFPSFHAEVARRALVDLNDVARTREEVEGVDRVAARVFNHYQAVHRRYVDDRLRFHFGVTTAELTSLSTGTGEARAEIAQKAFVKEAKKWTTGNDGSDASKRIFNNNGVVFGWSQRSGLDAYYVSDGYIGPSFASPISVLGWGNAVANHVVSRTLARMSLERRREGLPLVEGLYFLLMAAAEVRADYGTLGGYFQYHIVDAAGATPKTREIADKRGHLALETMKAHLAGYLARKDCLELIEALLVGDEPFEKVEPELFSRASNRDDLMRVLAGYKPSPRGFEDEVKPVSASRKEARA